MKFRHRTGCPDDGELRQAINHDGSVDPAIQEHLNHCRACATRFAVIADSAAMTARQISTLAPPPGDLDIDGAYRMFRRAMATQSARDTLEGSKMRQMFGMRSMRAASATIAVVAVIAAVTFSPMRTVADDFLSQFRVQKFAAVTIPMDALAPMQSLAMTGMSDADKADFEEQLGRLGSFDTTFDFDVEDLEHSTNLPESMTLDEAEAQFGDIDEPSDLPDGFDNAPKVYLTEAGSASFTMNTANVQELIDSIGLPIYSLPDATEYPTLEFKANLPAAALLEYLNADGERIVAGQMASPTLDIPESVDMDALREDILRFPGLPADLVAELRSIDDWENTLIIPIPEGATSDDITINGQPGLLIEHENGSAVLWEKDGILYAVIGQVSGDVARDIADSMQ